MELYIDWLQNHILAVVAVLFTLVLVYHYLIEKETGVRLTKRYRDSIFEAQSAFRMSSARKEVSAAPNSKIFVADRCSAASKNATNLS